MRRGETIHGGGDDVRHVLWECTYHVNDVGAAYLVTYCNQTIRKNVTLYLRSCGAAPTCVRCIVMRQADVQTLRRFSLSD